MSAQSWTANANHDLAQTECMACGADVIAAPPRAYLGSHCWDCGEPLMPPRHHATIDRMNAAGLRLMDAEAAEILARFPGAGEADARAEALDTLMAYILDDVTITEVGERRRATQQAAAMASVAAQTIARLEVLDGMAESEAARRAGVDRMTVRKMMGKR